MSHKTMIDGVAYEISGGKTLVNGTAYSIDKGKTLVDGTAYEVGFGPTTAIVTITLSDSMNTNARYVTINGQTYENGDSDVLTVPIGTKIECKITSAPAKSAYIYVNGTEVATAASGQNTVTYTHEVTRNTTVSLTHSSVSFWISAIIITEE